MAGRAADEILARLEPLGVRLELDIFRRLLAALGEPQRRVPALLVAGTNGKGSVAALLDAIARAAGLRVGLYTSPHLERWEERIRVGGAPIAAPALASRLERALAAARRCGLPPPTPFEALTAAAWLEFGRAAVDLAVVEVGLGGRLDATNACDPVLSLITRVALDHRAELGADLAAIAREKAGILRRGTPAVVAAQEPNALAALREAAARIGAPLHLAADEVRVGAAEWRGLAGHRLRLATPAGVHALELPLAGEHQIANAAVAVRAAELAAARWPAIDSDAIRRGVAACRWPGRLEAFAAPGGGTTVLLDAAHNPDGAAALARFLERLGQPYTLVFGCLADKDAREMLPRLVRGATSLVLTRPPSPRARPPEQLLALVPAGLAAAVEEEPRSALGRALAAGPGLLVVSGSIYLVGASRSWLSGLGFRSASA